MTTAIGTTLGTSTRVALDGRWRISLLKRSGALSRRWVDVEVSHFGDGCVVFWQRGHDRPTMVSGSLLVEPIDDALVRPLAEHDV